MSYQASKYVLLLIAMLAGVQLTEGVSKCYSCLLTMAKKRSKAKTLSIWKDENNTSEKKNYKNITIKWNFHL